MPQISRRDALAAFGTGAVVGLSGLVPGGASAAAPMQLSASTPNPFGGLHQPKPLKFDPGKLIGLSNRLITSHWENNYVGSVKALNMVEGRLAAAMADKNMPPVIYGDLKREELHRTGSVVLHELYFENLGGDGKAAGGVRTALASAFGSLGAWEAEFRRTAMSLAGGSGWCILALNPHSGGLHNYWMWDHMHAPATGVPLLALDMYEHSYHMDYGAGAARYVDAYMRNIDWQEVDRRHTRAVKIAALA